MITYVAPHNEEHTIANFLDDRGGPFRDRLRIISYRDLETRTRLVEYIKDDEYLEVTPKSLRMRKIS